MLSMHEWTELCRCFGKAGFCTQTWRNRRMNSPHSVLLTLHKCQLITGYRNANLKPSRRKRMRVCVRPHLCCLTASESSWEQPAGFRTSDIQQPYETLTKNKIWSHSLKGISLNTLEEKIKLTFQSITNVRLEINKPAISDAHHLKMVSR